MGIVTDMGPEPRHLMYTDIIFRFVDGNITCSMPDKIRQDLDDKFKFWLAPETHYVIEKVKVKAKALIWETKPTIQLKASMHKSSEFCFPRLICACEDIGYYEDVYDLKYNRTSIDLNEGSCFWVNAPFSKHVIEIDIILCGELCRSLDSAMKDWDPLPDDLAVEIEDEDEDEDEDIELGS